MEVILIGYSGHAYVVADILLRQEYKLTGYCENIEKKINPYKLSYLGKENDPKNLDSLKKSNYFIGIGSNQIRSKIQDFFVTNNIDFGINAIHPSSIISSNAILGFGIMIAANVVINPLAEIGNGVICNTGCIIEHECEVDDFVHIAPGAVLTGNVKIGKLSFLGANAVVKQGVRIGENVIIGAGAVIIEDVPNNAVVVGNPGRIIKYKK